MRHLVKAPVPAMIMGSIFLQIGCQSGLKPGIPDQTYKVKIASDAELVRTRHGEYVDGYLAECESRFQKQWMFIALEIQKYVKDDRLIVTGRPTEDFVRMSSKSLVDAEVPVFRVGRAEPNIPSAPNVPMLK